MTARKIIEKAALLLGFKSIDDSRLQEVSLCALNCVYAELFFLENESGFKEIQGLSEELKVSERFYFDVMPYGVAALIASGLGDMENHNYFSTVYNLKRKKHTITVFDDALPAGEGW